MIVYPSSSSVLRMSKNNVYLSRQIEEEEGSYKTSGCFVSHWYNIKCPRSVREGWATDRGVWCRGRRRDGVETGVVVVPLIAFSRPKLPSRKLKNYRSPSREWCIGSPCERFICAEENATVGHKSMSSEPRRDEQSCAASAVSWRRDVQLRSYRYNK